MLRTTLPDVMDNTLLSFNLSAVSQFTVSSVSYNPSHGASDWVDRMFGSKAVFYQKHLEHYDLGDRPLTDAEIDDRSEIFWKHFQLPAYALWPACSVDALGYVFESEDGDFTPDLRNTPFVGKAMLKIGKRSLNWRCFYRPVYENWREERRYSGPNYWAVLLYCPAPNQSACNRLEESIISEKEEYEISDHPTSESGSIEISTPHGNIWQASFRSRPFVTKDELYTSHNLTESTPNKGRASGTEDISILSRPEKLKSKPRTVPPAVCLSIPYTSTDTGKMAANGAILLEWIRYYALLGFKVIIYDRDGANEKHIFKSKYGISQKIRIPKGKLVYHPYTIRGLLDPSRKGLKYDNTEKAVMDDLDADEMRKGRFEAQGHDKVLTLTHCRFEAKALYGIETVLVVDYDEFLYCPVVAATARAQGLWIHRFMGHMKGIGVSQVEFTQRVVANKTESPRDCVVSQAERGKSIFDCFSSYHFYNGAHSVKSLHLDYTCPLTGYHNACPPANMPRSHNCLCNTRVMKSNNWRPYEHRKGRECAVVHISTNSASYGRKEYAFTREETIEALKSVSELGIVVNGIGTPHQHT